MQNQNFVWGTEQPTTGFGRPQQMSREQALASVGKPANYTTLADNMRQDLSSYMGGHDLSGVNHYNNPNDSRYGLNDRSSGFSGNSSVDGISAVNPQAGQANELDAFQRYEDAAYDDAMLRLQPQIDASQRQFDQQMASQGIPVGSDAYNTAKAQFEQNKAGALQSAAFGAMQFGLGAQDQSFRQDHARSSLANALLQAQWQKELGWGNIGLGHANLGLQQNRLNESARQFDSQLGYNYDTFYDTLGQRNYEFDSNMDFNMWDRGNYWDFAYDRADSSDYFNAWDRDYNSQQDFMRLVAGLFGGGPGSADLHTNYSLAPGNTYDWSWMF